jgi:2-(3-amino-3-carboxypropyl)histidine synthase
MLSEKTFRRLKELKAKRVMLQLPEGLKVSSHELVGSLQKEGFEVILSVEPCFGACDLNDREAKALSCDALLHVGHSDFGVKPVLPVVYDEWEHDFDPISLLKKNMRLISGFKKIGLASTVQYAGSLLKAKEFLRREGKDVFIGKSGRLKDGQVLGCDASSAKKIEAKVECFLFIGSGSFHPLGLLKEIRKPVFFLDIEGGRMRDISGEREKAEIKRRMRIEKARGLSRFAVFVSTKPGQVNVKKAIEIRRSLSRKGKDSFIISAGTLSPEKIMGMGIDILVNTACPRIYDDQELFGLVILNPDDVREL